MNVDSYPYFHSTTNLSETLFVFVFFLLQTSSSTNSKQRSVLQTNFQTNRYYDFVRLIMMSTL